MKSTIETVTQEILCGSHADVCCVQPAILEKLERWRRVHGWDKTIEMIKMACECKAQGGPAAAPTAAGTDSAVATGITLISSADAGPADGPREFTFGDPKSGGTGIARKVQDHINAVDAAYATARDKCDNDFPKDKDKRMNCQRDVDLATIPALGFDGWNNFYPFDAGFPSTDLLQGKDGWDPALVGLATTMGVVWSGGSMFDSVDLGLRNMATQGITLVGGVKANRLDLPSFKNPQGYETGALAGYEPYPVIGLAAGADGWTLLNADPAASFYLALLGIHDGGELLASDTLRFMLFTWVVENRRADLLSAFTLGPWNTWLGRSKLADPKAVKSVFNTWASIEDAMVWPYSSWLHLLSQELMDTDGGTELLQMMKYVRKEVPTGQLGLADVLDPATGPTMTRFLRAYSDRNRMNLTTDEIRPQYPSGSTSGGNLAGNMIAIRDAFTRRAVELKLINTPIKDLEHYDWQKRAHDQQMKALVGALTLGISMVATVMTAGAGSAIAGALGGAVSSALGAAWKAMGGYVTVAWNAISQSGVLTFASQYVIPNVITALQMTGNKVPPLLREVGGLASVNADDIKKAYGNWATSTGQIVTRETGKLLTPPKTIKL